MKLNNITFQRLTIYDKATGEVTAETTQNPSMYKIAEYGYFNDYLCLKCPDCGNSLGLRGLYPYRGDEQAQCYKCGLIVNVPEYEKR